MKKYRMIRTVLACFLLLGLHGFGLCQNAEKSTIEIPRLDFENADIRHVMKTLGEIGDRNIILDKEITGDITVFLRDVTWEAALIAVLNMNNLIGYEENGFIKILTRENYNLQMSVLQDQEKKEIIEEKLAEPKKVEIIKIHNADAANIKLTLDQLLGDEDKPSVDTRTNSLVFTATDSSLFIIKDIVNKLDKETKQVSIEVRMIKVDTGSLTEIGVNWSAVKNDNKAELSTLSEAGKLFVGKYTGTVSDAAFNATIASLIDKDKAEVISRPHITTQDNEPAIISSGQQIPFLSYDESRNVIREMIDATTVLDVTPHILSDERILLDINVKRSSGQPTGLGVTVTVESADLKMITTNGETAVIGGMRRTQDIKQDKGIPILQNIPLLGQLFKYSRIENKKTDLIIFITPNIIQPVKASLSE